MFNQITATAVIKFPQSSKLLTASQKVQDQGIKAMFNVKTMKQKTQTFLSLKPGNPNYFHMKMDKFLFYCVTMTTKNNFYSIKFETQKNKNKGIQRIYFVRMYETKNEDYPMRVRVDKKTFSFIYPFHYITLIYIINKLYILISSVPLFVEIYVYLQNMV